MSADSLFSLMGAMLMSEKVKTWAPNIFPHIVKTMDRHYTAGGIANDAQKVPRQRHSIKLVSTIRTGRVHPTRIT